MGNIIEYAAYIFIYGYILHSTRKSMKKIGIPKNEVEYVDYYGLVKEEHFFKPNA